MQPNLRKLRHGWCRYSKSKPNAHDGSGKRGSGNCGSGSRRHSSIRKRRRCSDVAALWLTASLGDVQFYEQCQCSRGRRTLTPSCRRPRWRPWRRPTSPTATTCRFAIVQDNLAGAELSDAQLETMLYAFQRFGRRLPDDSRAPASC
ncbi:hypothetical protein CHLRE_02g095054v5 [Chlamydomonas reinhardtii]|uniref:Uncharacterized protein n=1 Tax=Chlamydomonas reinhardtii TaxID=3055 RepID=A0A2K3E1K1_CHLRE|nr:uncharacterized protein CHLRE_02g095054v5 [Chlamydomonas reinhardtii]PNW86664.1 hypothetical protein CHLRE_02g095054v5 [Chlamydomonas reinhardtii]